jgi:glycine cleavage system H protein
MEAYTYTNLFDTKGIEYIVIIFFLLLLIPFWIVVNRKSEVATKMQQAIQTLTAAVLRIPRGLFVSRNHTWLYLEKSGEAKVGIDDFMLKVLGDIRVNPIKAAGEKVKKGEVVAIIDQAGKRLKLRSPITGEVSGFNSELEEDFEAVNTDPYESGWLYTIQPDNWKAETSDFLLGKEIMPWMEKEMQRLKDFLNLTFARQTGASVTPVFQEGGELQMNPLAEMNDEVWNDFQKEFLEQTG